MKGTKKTWWKCFSVPDFRVQYSFTGSLDKNRKLSAAKVFTSKYRLWGWVACGFYTDIYSGMLYHFEGIIYFTKVTFWKEISFGVSLWDLYSNTSMEIFLQYHLYLQPVVSTWQRGTFNAISFLFTFSYS